MAAATDATTSVPAEEPAAAPQQSKTQDINPWSVSGEVGEDGKVKAIDYRKLIDEFGTAQIDDALLERFEKVTGQKPHRFMRRGIFFSHRDMTTILDRYEKVFVFSPSLKSDAVSKQLHRMSRFSFTLVADLAVIACTLDIPKCLTLSSRLAYF